MHNRTIEPFRSVPRSEEHIDISGHLKVPVTHSIDPAPEREGWVPFWVNINLNPDSNDGIEKVVSYKREEIVA
jgi:hypothetical protein